MAIEKKWESISPVPFVVNGTVDGIVTISSVTRFKVKQEVYLAATGQDTILIEIKRVISATQLLVGPKGKNLSTVMDVSAFTVAAGAVIYAPEQSRPSIPAQEHERAVYEEEPTVAKRVFIVDELGNPVDGKSPLPVLATVQPLEGPSAQLVLSVGTATVIEIKVGASALPSRKVITLQPLTGQVYLYFGDDGAAPSAATVAASGLVLYRKAKETYEASASQKVYMLAVTGTATVAVVERA